MRHARSFRVRVRWLIGHMGVVGMTASVNRSPVSDSWSTSHSDSLVLVPWDWKLQFSWGFS